MPLQEFFHPLSTAWAGFMKDTKLYIVMVGLPARGKTTIATKLKENFTLDSIKARIFNNGELRRKMIRGNTAYAGFFDPGNKEGVALREKIAHININRARRFLDNQGKVAILDATNASLERRQTISRLLHDHPLLFIECINNDADILKASILRKIDLEEFGHLTQEEAIQSFRQRISYYQSIYTSIREDFNFIKLDSLNNRIIEQQVITDVPYHDQIRDFLVTDTVKNLYLIRHGETYFNLEDRIGGDSPLTPKGKAQGVALGEFFKRKKVPLIFTSEKKRTIQTAEPIQGRQKASEIIPLAEFNEIDSGICECMSYEEIRRKMPAVAAARQKDKYNYIYPEGEGYITMQERIDRGIKKAIYLSNPSDNIMIIGHRAVNRMILSHFLFRRKEDVPYIYIPQDKFYYISATQNKKVFQLKRYE
jgi:broad specificity phosphatase PhoE/predicted kinase